MDEEEKEQEELLEEEEKQAEKKQLGENESVEEAPVEEEPVPEKGVAEKAADMYSLYKKAQKLMNLKIVASIAAALAPIALIVGKIVLVLTLVVVVISILLSFIDGIYSYGDKLYNFFRTGTFEASEHIFIETLEHEYRRYQRFNNIEDDFDLPLVLATVNYGRMIDPDGLNFEQYEALGELFSEGETGFGGYIPSDHVRSFYRVMENELGEIYTMNLAERKLLAHLVGIKLGKTCVSTIGLDLDFFNNLAELGHAVSDTVDDIGMLFQNWLDIDELTVDDLPDVALDMLPLPLLTAVRNLPQTIGIPFVLLYNVKSYADVRGADGAWEAYSERMYVWGERISVTWGTQNPWALFMRIYEASIEDESTCGPGEWAIPAIVLYQDYELYKEYLVNYFIPVFYIDCPNCQYRGIDKDDPFRAIIINRMVDEIFKMRDLYVHFLPVYGIDEGDAFPFPGVTSFIFEPEKCTVPTTYDRVLNARDADIMSNMRDPHGPPYKTGPYGGCVTNSFGNRLIRGAVRHHAGVDFGLPNRTELYAMASGTVIVSSRHSINFFGYFVAIDHGEINGERYVTRYLHMAEPSPLRVGDMVLGGQYVGLSGNTGAPPGSAAYGAHLHFDLIKNGTHVNPVPYLQAILDGTSEFDTGSGGAYYLMADYNADYCGDGQTVANSGQLPTSYAMIASALANETSPNQVANFICQNMPDNKQAIITSATASSTFGISSRSIDLTINAIKAELGNDRMILVHTNRGPFNTRGENYLVISRFHANQFLVLDPMHRENTKGYTEQEIRDRILNFTVDNNIWSFSAGGGSGGQPGGTITQFNEVAWENHLRSEVQSSSLGSLRPSDASSFFTGGQITDNNWMSLLTAMSYRESGHNPDLQYQENFFDSSGNYVISTGLFQMSQESIRGYRFPGYENVTTEQLKNPYTNISIAVKLLEYWIVRDGCIACQHTCGRVNCGGSRYWAVLRPGTALNQIKTATLQASSRDA